MAKPRKAQDQHHYEKGKWAGEPPYESPNPVRMKRTVGKGEKGDEWSLTNNATYGLGVGTEPTRMSRTVGKGPNGNGIERSANGPGRSSRKDTGANTHMGRRYGVDGVSGGADGGYGGS